MGVGVTLQKAHSQANDIVAGVPLRKSNDGSAGVSAMSRMLIGDYFSIPGTRRTAEWSANHDQILSLYKGSLFICANTIASKIASMGFKVLRKRYSKALGIHYVPVSHNHPLHKLLECPNVAYTPFNMHATAITWWLISGNAYLEKVKNGFGTPVALWPISPQFVRPIPSSDRWVQGYRVMSRYYGANSWDVHAKEMIHIKEPAIDQQGTQRFYGFPRALACEAAIELENQMFTRERYRFSNYAEPGMVIGTDTKIGNAAQLKTLVHEIWSQHRVAEQSGVPMILHSGMKLQSQPKGGNELNYSASLMMTLKFIAATFQLPLSVVGLNEDSSRASAEASLKTYAENCINPRLVAYGQALTLGLARDFEPDLEIQIGPFDTSSLAELQSSIESLGRIGGITQNEARAVMLRLPPMENGGNTPVLQAGVTLAPFGNDNNPSNNQIIPATGV